MTSTPLKAELHSLLRRIDAAYARLQPQVIRPAEGYIKYDYLIPTGFYKQMWDWDGFFIGNHRKNQSKENAKYLKWWVMNLANSIDSNGYVSSCINTKGPLYGKLRKVITYRESTEYDPKYGFRSLSKKDPVYNNRVMMIVYSKWQGADLDKCKLY